MERKGASRRGGPGEASKKKGGLRDNISDGKRAQLRGWRNWGCRSDPGARKVLPVIT